MDRALPRVEDGLKPVQRRILFAMHEMGLEPDKPFRKSAGIVGECLGKYHPHGDSSVYDAMVRLAQPFNLNMPLVIGQGNFGSEDGDPAAAMRYTEAKLSHLATELLRDIDKETVPFSLTFDDRNTEPDILPGRYPNLLVNGATGIAVGLATNIPPHNLGEVIDAHIAYIDNPKITLAQVMKIIKGPDFPTGGFVTAGEDLVNAYKTGKGKVIMRAKIHIEVEGNDRRNIVITELPYQVNKVTLQRNIADLRESKKDSILSNIQEIRDESDRKGMRVVIRIRRDTDAKEICKLLFKYTNLQCNYNINIVAIADGKPKQLGLLPIIEYYVNYQREVILKRSQYDLENAKERAHILEGLLIAIRAIDEVVYIIKTSKNTTEARERLRKTFELSERQAQAILDLRLARLTSLEVFKLEQELAELQALIKKLEAIIASKKLQFDVVKTELLEIKKKYKIDRRSRIISDIEDAVITADDDEKPIEDAVVVLTAAGTVKRMPAKHYSMSRAEFSSGLGINDINSVVVAATTDKLVYLFTNIGNCYKIMAGDIPECKLRDKGTRLKEMFSEASVDEFPVAAYAIVPDQFPESELIWLTRQGMIKRSTWTESCAIQKHVFQCYKLRDDKPDAVIRVEEFKPGKTLMLLGSGGYVLHAQTADVPIQGRIAAGVKGIQIGDDEFAVCNAVTKTTGFLVAVTNLGNIKKTPCNSIEKMMRYRKGVKLGVMAPKETIVFASVVRGDEDIIVQNDKGVLAFMPIEKVSNTDRTKPFKPFPGVKNIKAAWIHKRRKNN
jgi:DNA gyrase subunit A